MWLAGSETWDLFVGQNQTGCARQGAAPTWHPHENLHLGLSNAFKLVRHQHAGWRRPRLRVWLSGALARPFVLVKPVGLQSEAELTVLAKAMAVQATGLQDAVALWLSDAGEAGSILGVAMDAGLRDHLLDAARKTGIKLLSLRPLWAKLLDEALAGNRDVQLLAAEDPDALTVIVSREEEWATADGYHPAPEKGQQESLVARRMIAANITTDNVVRVSGALGPIAATSSAWLSAQIPTSPATR